MGSSRMTEGGPDGGISQFFNGTHFKFQHDLPPLAFMQTQPGKIRTPLLWALSIKKSTYTTKLHNQQPTSWT